MRSIQFLAHCIVACFLAISALHTPARAGEPLLLESDPPCVAERLGRVRITVGEERPDPRRGGAVPGVSYARALSKLTAAAAQRRADAVVIREHQADYFAKGSRRPSRATHVMLAGVALRLKPDTGGCALAKIGPVEFERSALERDRENIGKNAGVNF